MPVLINMFIYSFMDIIRIDYIHPGKLNTINKNFHQNLNLYDLMI